MNSAKTSINNNYLGCFYLHFKPSQELTLRQSANVILLTSSSTPRSQWITHYLISYVFGQVIFVRFDVQLVAPLALPCRQSAYGFTLSKYSLSWICYVFVYRFITDLLTLILRCIYLTGIAFAFLQCLYLFPSGGLTDSIYRFNYLPWSGRRDSNSQQSDWKSETLPLSYYRI